MKRFLILIFLMISSCSFAYTNLFDTTFNYKGSHSCQRQVVVYTADGVCNTQPYVLVFEDNFDGNTLNTNKWKPINGVVRDPDQGVEQQWYSSSNIEVSNGTLKLITKRDTLLNQEFEIWVNGGMQTYVKDFYFSSAEIDSRTEFGYGKYEIRCKIPKGVGFWPAFWMFGGFRSSEIDVFEFWNEAELSRNHNMNCHYDYDNEITSNHSCISDYRGPDFSQDFHVFTLVRTPYVISWYVDGVHKHSKFLLRSTLNQVLDCHSVQAFHSYVISKFFPRGKYMNIIANLAIQSGGNTPNMTTPFPSALEIDYIRYYKRAGCSNNIYATNINQLQPNSSNQVIGRTINLSGNFTVPSTSYLHLIASDKITIKKNFKTNHGCVFTAKTNKYICDHDDDSGKDELYYDDFIENVDEEEVVLGHYTKTEDSLLNKISITKTEQNIYAVSSNNANVNAIYNISCININNNQLLQYNTSLSNPVIINLEVYHSGLYFIIVRDENGVTTTKKVI